MTGGFLGPGATWFLGAYLVSLIAIGWLGRRARRDEGLADFFLAGRGMGLATLFLTLYATQYSGNALVGFPANAYRQGFLFLNAITFMVGIVGVYWLFAPRLQRLAAARAYLTPGDLVRDRFGDRTLVAVLNVVFVVVLASYILANLKAVGQVLEAVTGGGIGFATAVWFAAFIMVVYESLGGMRSVAWTDAIQGMLLLAGCIVIFLALDARFGGFALFLDQLATVRPEFWEPPGAGALAGWASVIIVIAFGAAVYPQALQRIFAARDGRTLKRSFQLMLLMPLVTITLVLAIGLAGAAAFPGLDRAGSEGITLALLGDLVEAIPALRWLFVLFLAAAVAAIMSTVDSALLTISSIFTQDVYRRWRPATPEAELTRAGKWFSWGTMALAAMLAIYLPQTIWKLTVVKLEVLCQAAPAIICAVQAQRPAARPVLLGLLAGLAVVLGLKLLAGLGMFPSDAPLGIEGGAWGLAVNVTVLAALGRRYRRTDRQTTKSSAPTSIG
ncbi:MAG: sodium:solute symporter family protein [Pseudomonadota bacterium]